MPLTRLYRPLLLLPLLTLAAPTLAGSLLNTQLWSPVISLGTGTAISQDLGASQNFPSPMPGVFNFYNYSADNGVQSTQLFEGFVGAEWHGIPQWAMQVGVDYSSASDFSANGNLTQGIDVPSENTYTYNYDISTRQWLLETKWLYLGFGAIHPYFLAGAGESFNNASDYQTNVPFTETFTRDYQDANAKSFSYALGVGVDVAMNAHLRFGLGYRFADLGRVTLGAASVNGSAVDGTLSQNHLYLNEILGQVTAVF